MNSNKKNIYLVQASAVYGESIKTAYLPYAAGCLAAYAFSFPEIKSAYHLGRFIYIRENTEQAVASMEKPYLVGFSTYIWNMEYNRCFAEKLKQKFPDTIIVFGGHNMKPNGEDLRQMPFADIIMHGEGEVPFYTLLNTLLNGGDLGSVNNISYRKEGKIVSTPLASAPEIADFPSPYTMGLFDELTQNEEIAPSVIWETNRGCPNQCAFCDWGALKSKTRMFSDTRLEAELEWMVKHKVEYVYCADANFGLFERDTKIADRIIELKNTYGYPKVFKTNYTKNKDDVVFEISNKLMKASIGKSPTLSFQSLSPTVLENIGRSNMALSHFKNLMVRYSKAQATVYSELILGLPGETYESFVKGISTLLDCNQHTSIGIYPCELLPNSKLGSEAYIQKFGIKTVRTRFIQYHIQPQNGDIEEYSNIVIGTNTMPTPDWKRAFIFSVCVQALHNLGLTRAIAMFLHREVNVCYSDFYEEMIAYMQALPENRLCRQVINDILSFTDGVAAGTHAFAHVYGEHEKLTWSFEEYMFIALVKEKHRFYDEILPFLQKYDLDSQVQKDLLLYQNALIKTPAENTGRYVFHYNWQAYFGGMVTERDVSLKQEKHTLVCRRDNYKNCDEWARYCVWYGRRADRQLNDFENSETGE